MSGTMPCERLELLAFAGAEDAIEDAHAGIEPTGWARRSARRSRPSRPGRHRSGCETVADLRRFRDRIAVCDDPRRRCAAGATVRPREPPGGGDPAWPRRPPGRPRRRRPLERAAAARSVAPVVTTSSTSRTRAGGTCGWARNAGACKRASPAPPGLRAVAAGPARAAAGTARRAGGRRGGPPARPGRSRAPAPARRWSAPRSRRRRRGPPPTSRLTSRPARCPATARRLRYLKPSSTSRTRPENGGGDQDAVGRVRVGTADEGEPARCGRSGRPGRRSRHSVS